MKKIVIITGASKGIGNALALEYKSKGYAVYSIARTIVENLPKNQQISCDLSNLEESVTRFKDLLKTITSKKPTHLTLINNAGTLGDTNRIENIDSQNIIATVNLNLTIPLLFSSIFIQQTKNRNSIKKIITISSGAAYKTYYGWSVYCATKAGIDSFTKVIAKEQKTAKNPVGVIAIYPGLVDTDMQTEIRTKSTIEFSNVERFINKSKNNQLLKTTEIAKKIIALDKTYKNATTQNVLIDINLSF